MKSKMIGILISTLLVLTTVLPVSGYRNNKSCKEINTVEDEAFVVSLNYVYNGYTDITVEEARDMLIDTSNGIQIPVDVRTDGEWRDERIDTSFPEDPRHHIVTDLQNENKLQDFISLYNGSEIIFYCKSGGRSRTAAIILNDSEFNGTIYNMLGGITSWKTAGFPTKTGNQVPNQPAKPSGSTNVRTEVSYIYSTITTDPDIDSVKYGWDWDGDDIVDEWTDYNISGITINTSHTWDNPGTYDVKVKVEDSVGDQSEFSLVLTITVVVNNPPDTPIISGNANGRAGNECEYTFVATDPDEDDVSYYVKWGDGNTTTWTAFQSSGPPGYSESHTWSEQGTYTIEVKAKDQYDVESDWATLSVSMPRNKLITKTVFQQLLDQLIQRFPLIAKLLQLPVFKNLINSQ
jgi:rhodanese-related sulfurtransferase